jgi:hypothetical protein
MHSTDAPSTGWTLARIGFVAVLVLALLVGSLAALILLRDGSETPRVAPPPMPSASSSPVPSLPLVDLTEPPRPFRDRYPVVRRWAATVGGDTTTVHVPAQESAGRTPRPLPLAVLLSDPTVDASQFGQFGRDLAAQGVIVVVAPRSGAGSVADVQSWARAEVADPTSSMAGQLAAERVMVVAHGAASPTAAELAEVEALVRVLPATPGRGRGPEASATATLTDSSGADPLLLTDTGSREARGSGSLLRSDRAGPILDAARLVGAWGRATLGNAASAADLSELSAAPDARFVLTETAG